MAQATAFLLTYPKFHAQTITGAALVGGKLYTYYPGTTTPKATYKDSAKVSANTNPIILDSNGDAVVYLTGAYDLVLKNSLDVTQWSWLNITGMNQYTSYETDALNDYGAGTSYTSTSINAAIAAIGATYAVLVLRAGTWVISANVTIPANIILKPLPGAIMARGSGKVVTFAGDNIDAGRYQIFSGTGTTAGLLYTYPEWFGAVRDGTTDDSVAGNDAITSLVPGGTVILRPGSYVMENLAWTTDGITIDSCGRSREDTIVRGTIAGTNRVIYVVGTSGNYVKNVTLRNFTIRNGTAGTGAPTATKDGARFEYVDGLTVENMLFTEIQGTYGLVWKYSKNIRVRDNKFYRWGDTGCMSLIDSENIWVERNEFDTCTRTGASDTYTFACGAETLSQGTFFVKNIHVCKNIFKNNQTWEGLDCHGGEDIWIEDNYIENVKTGIMVSLASGYVSAPILKNVHIKGNTVIRGNGNEDQAGLILHGAIADSVFAMAENVWIEDNHFKGFGYYSANSVNSGVITIYDTKNVHILRNTFEDWQYNGILLYYGNLDVEIKKNIFLNVGAVDTSSGDKVTGNPACIKTKSYGNWLIDIQDNEYRPTADTYATVYMFYSSVTLGTGAYTVKNNHSNKTDTLYFGTGIQFGKTLIPEPSSAFSGRFGDTICDTYGRAMWTVTSPLAGIGSLDTTSVLMKCDILATSKELTVNASQSGMPDVSGSIHGVLVEGCNVVVSGAGAGGVDLNACIVDRRIDGAAGVKYILDTAASTSVTNVDVKLQTLTLQGYNQGETLLSSTTISFLGNGDTTLFTVPTGLRCILTRAVIVLAADAGGTTLSIGKSGTTTDFLPAQTLSGLDIQYDVGILQPIPSATTALGKSYAAASVIAATVGSHAGGAGNTLLLYGILY